MNENNTVDFRDPDVPESEYVQVEGVFNPDDPVVLSEEGGDETGELFIPNVGHGHLEFKFDKEDKEDTEKAKQVIQDMLKRGYSIFVTVDGEMKKVKSFDPEKELYYIDMPQEEGGKKKGGRKKGVPMKKTKAAGVAPTAGG